MSTPIKVIFVASTLQRTGPTNQLLNLVKNLDPNRFDPHIITLSPEPSDSLKQQFIEHRVAVTTLNLSRFKAFFSCSNRIIDIAQRTRAGLIHTQGIRADIIASNSAFLCFPRIATLRNYPQIDYPLTYGRVPGHIMARIHSQRLRKLDLTVGVSTAVTENLKDLAPGTRATTVMNGVDNDFFTPAVQPEKDRIRRDLAIPSSTTVWIASGHLSERKDPLTLVKSFKKAFGNDSSQLLLLIGAGPLESAIRELAEDSINIRVEGRVAHVKNYLQTSDFYVSASIGEGLPNAALEAMACGLPVLLSDISPHQQLVDMDTNIGTTFRTRDVDGLVNGLHYMLGSDSSTMRQSVLDLTEHQLSAHAMAANYQALYDRLLNQELS